MRPRPAAEAYLRLRTLPGEQAQVDWGHFGHLAVGRARRPLMAFVMVLSHSRRIFLRFFLDAHGATFVCGHAEGFRSHWAVWGYHAPEHFAVAANVGLPAVELEDLVRLVNEAAA